MKKIANILIGIILSLGVFAQAPQGFNYQAVVRNPQGEPLVQQQVSIRIVLQDVAGTLIHYSETHTATTSPQGVVSFVVGGGTVQSGVFADIPWGDGNIHMKVEVDPTGGSNYTTLGVSQLQSVPYALYAASGNVGPQGPEGPEGPVGPQGEQGEDGQSAYEIWLGQGNSGTEEDFLASLTGSVGPQGVQGEDGQSAYEIWLGQGNSGTEGDFLASLTGATGPQGEQGEQGPAGPQGEPGPQGEQGPTGPQGEQGPTGPQGEQGPTGPQGEQGPAGPKGDRGETGPQGPQGFPGEVGPEGPRGPAGVGLTLRGSWSPDATYVEGDYVFDESSGTVGVNSMWICQNAVGPSAIQPKDDTDNWVEFQAPEGPEGPQGPEGPLVPGLEGQTLRHNGTTWEASSTIYNSGSNVGIGTTNPLARLTIVNTGGNPAIPSSSASSGMLRIRTSSYTFEGVDIGKMSTAPYIGWLQVGYSGSTAESFTLQPMGGNVGIGTGTESPTQRLDVNGQLRIRGGTPATGRVLMSMDNLGNAQWQDVGGLQGEQGEPGEDGQSAYEIWLGLGNTGTEEDFLASLTGPAGPQGTEGPLVSGTVGQTLRHGTTTWEASSNIYNTGTNVGIGTTSPMEKLDVAGNIRAHGLTLNKQGTPGEDPLFVVRNSAGLVVFAVYEQGVRIYVDGDPDDEGKGNKSGFAIGGLTGFKDTGEEYFRVSRGYTQVLFDDEDKGNKSGFAIGGLTGFKADEDEKDFFSVSRDRTQVLFDDAEKGNKSGFAIGGLTGFKGKAGEGNDGYMSITPENYLIGQEAGYSLTTGLYNSFMGYQSGKATTGGGQNTFIGYQTGYGNTTGQRNVFVGTESGYSNTTGANNTFIGTEAGRSNTTGSSNIFLGNQSGYSNMVGTKNVFLGDKAGYYNTAGNNVFLGTESGYSNTSGTNNTFMGNQTGRSNTTGGSNIFLGYMAGYANSTSSNNVFIGNESGRLNTVGTNNAFMGNNAGGANTTGNSNVFIGNNSGRANTEGNSNVMIGDSAGYAQTGNFANKNVFIGQAAGKRNRSYNNIFIGSQAGYSNEGGQNIIAIGERAGYMNTGSQNIFIGTSAGESNTTGFGNLIIGRYAGKDNTTAGNQVLLGYNAGTQLTTGGSNVIIGSNAGAANTVGVGNVYVGDGAGRVNTGSKNVILGYNVGLNGFGSVSDRLIIDGGDVTVPLVWGEFDNRRFAINATNPTQTLDVNGTARIRTVGSDTYFAPLNITNNGTLTTSTSDVRLKTDIATLDNALNKVLKLRGVSFKWKDNPAMGSRIGFIAQEMEPVLPELVFTNEADGYKGVNYAEMTAVLVEAIKEQQEIIEGLKKSVNDQGDIIEYLQREIEQLKQKGQ